MSRTTRSGWCSATASRQPVCVPEGRDDLVSGVLEQSREPLAEQYLILGDHDPHGNSAVSVVPAPWSLSMRSVPP